LARIQTPEKSGLPSVVRGVGASMRTFPSASRGAFASGNTGHCAARETEQAITTTIIITFSVHFTIAASFTKSTPRE
jgi:hypothetical protein